MPRELFFSEPKPVFTVDQKLLRSVRRLVGEREIDVNPIFRVIERQHFISKLGKKDGGKLHRVMGPLLEAASIVIGSNVCIDIDCRPCDPGIPQRSTGNWHQDRSSSRVIVSDELPTQFVSGTVSGQHPVATAYEELCRDYGSRTSKAFSDAVDDAIEYKDLQLFPTLPLTGYLFDGQVHKSQLNQQDNPIDRCFIRLSI
jgi:hypothetical protein